MAKTGASTNVSGCDRRIRSALVLMVVVCCSNYRNTSLTNRASDSTRCSALLATFSLIAIFSKLWLDLVGYSRRVILDFGHSRINPLQTRQE
jgi:hypothetical protein